MTEHLMARSRTTIVLSPARRRVGGHGRSDARDGRGPGHRPWWARVYLGVWVTMTAAIMLPSAVSAARHVARLSCRVPMLLFTAGYLAVWRGYGLLPCGVLRPLVAAPAAGISSNSPASQSGLASHSIGRVVTGP
jgi:predicted metal-binding membrane protein